MEELVLYYRYKESCRLREACEAGMLAVMHDHSELPMIDSVHGID